jgi:hypothetical protein
MEKQKYLESLYHQACLAGFCRTRAEFAEFIGVHEKSISKALNGDESYLTDKLFDRIKSKFYENGISSQYAEQVSGDNLQGDNVQNRVNSELVIAKFLHEIAEQRKLTQEVVAQNAKLIELLSSKQ